MSAVFKKYKTTSHIHIYMYIHTSCTDIYACSYANKLRSASFSFDFSFGAVYANCTSKPSKKTATMIPKYIHLWFELCVKSGFKKCIKPATNKNAPPALVAPIMIVRSSLNVK